MKEKEKLARIDLSDFRLMYWLANKAVSHLTKKRDKKLAKDTLKRFAKVVKIIDSWGESK